MLDLICYAVSLDQTRRKLETNFATDFEKSSFYLMYISNGITVPIENAADILHAQNFGQSTTRISSGGRRQRQPPY